MTTEVLFKPHPRRCDQCGFPTTHCLCAEIPSVPCRTSIVIVRHAAELNKASNTGGLTARVLGATRIDQGISREPVDLTGTLGATPRLLLPGGVTSVEELSTLVVLDGSWQQVRSMRSRIPPLPAVPLLSLATAPVRHRMRRPGEPGRLSTMEAVAAILDQLGEPEPAAALRTLYDELVRRWRELRYGSV